MVTTLVKIGPIITVFCIFGVILSGCIENAQDPEPSPSSIPTHTPIPVSASTLSQEEINVEIVKKIVEDYYTTHTYSMPDLFVCGDMAIDVWNMVETQGINAEIVVGNVDNPDADWTEYNHAWIVAEVSSGTWLALETTGGYVTYNENYYNGYFFKNPGEYKQYSELASEYNALIDRISELQVEYAETYDKWVKETEAYQELVSEYNRKYTDRYLSPREYQDSSILQSEIYAQYAVVERISGKADQLVHAINEENKRLSEVTNKLNALLA